MDTPIPFQMPSDASEPAEPALPEASHPTEMPVPVDAPAPTPPVGDIWGDERPEDPWGAGPSPKVEEPRRRGRLRRRRSAAEAIEAAPDGGSVTDAAEEAREADSGVRALRPLPTPASPGPRRSLMEAVRLRPWLLALCVVAFTGAGIVAGLARTPVYTAEARSAVSRIDVTTQSLPGFAAGVQSLAVAYSRIIGAQQVTDATAAALGEDPDVVGARLDAAPIPESPLFRVFGTGDSPEQAIATANAASRALRDYVTKLNAQNPDATRLYGRFTAAVAARQKASAALASARASGDPEAVSAAVAALAGANLKVDTLRGLYQQSQQGTANANVIQVITPANTAYSDRRSTLQRLAVTGLVAGVLVGLALCMLLGGRVAGGYVPRHARS